MSIEVANTLLMMDLYISFQSERHIAPFVILYIIFCYRADGHLGRDSSGVFRRSEAAILSWIWFAETTSGVRKKDLRLSDEIHVKSQI